MEPNPSSVIGQECKHCKKKMKYSVQLNSGLYCTDCYEVVLFIEKSKELASKPIFGPRWSF